MCIKYTGDSQGFDQSEVYAINSFWDLNMICNGSEGIIIRHVLHSLLFYKQLGL